MGLWLSIVLIIGPLLLSTYFTVKKKWTVRKKIVVWFICIFLCMVGIIRLIKEKEEKKKQFNAFEYHRYLAEKQELYHRGFSVRDVERLGETPLLKYLLVQGERYRRKSKFEKAIEKFKECLLHPGSTEEIKIELSMIIGNCYYALSKITEAEKYYKQALKISKRAKEGKYILQARAKALTNLAFIYGQLGKYHKRFRLNKQALKIREKIGDEQGMAVNLANLGLIYIASGKVVKGLRHYGEAMEIHRKKGDEQALANGLKGIGFVFKEFGVHTAALRCLKEALEIFKRIGTPADVENVLTMINAIEDERKKGTRQD